MKKEILTMTLVAAGLFGCATNNKKLASIPSSDSVTDISAPTPAFAPTPQPITLQPTALETSSTPGGAGAMGGSYTVKKGDTLYGIARNRYGDGKAWSRIASANPGLSPSTLKVGQTITVP